MQNNFVIGHIPEDVLPGRAILRTSTADDTDVPGEYSPAYTCTKSWQNKVVMIAFHYGSEITNWPHEPEPGSAQHSIRSSSSMSLRSAPYETKACETMWTSFEYVNSCECHVLHTHGHMEVIWYLMNTFSASRLFPSRVQPGRMVPPWYKLMPICGCKRFWKLHDKINDYPVTGEQFVTTSQYYDSILK